MVPAHTHEPNPILRDQETDIACNYHSALKMPRIGLDSFQRDSARYTALKFLTRVRVPLDLSETFW
jgi:hypothetical protein